MESRRRSLVLLSPVLFLLLSLLACSAGRPLGGPLTLPCEPMISEAAADRLQEKARPIVEERGPELFTLQTTQDEVTSLLARVLQEHPGESPVADPCVCFTPGQIHLAGRFANIAPFEFRGAAAVALHLVGERVEIEITQAAAGPILLPGALLRALSKTISETLAESELGFRFSAIEVGEGVITVSGRRSQT